MKKLLIMLCVTSMLAVSAPVLAKQNEKKVYEQQLHERSRKANINSIKTFLPFSYNELDRLQQVVEYLKLNDPTNDIEIEKAEILVKKKQNFIADREKELKELEAVK